MEYLFDEWNILIKKLSNKYIYLFLDYDGTLTPIVDKPQNAVIPQKIKALLGNLSKASRCKIAIISGRALNDVKKMVGIKNIIYVGNYGLEIDGPKIKFKSQIHPRFLTILKHIKEELNKRLSGIRGAFVEDKGLTLSLHYRLVDKKYISQVKTVFHEVIITHLVGDRMRTKTGKMVFEVKPPIEWDKGKIVLWLLARQQFASRDNKVFPIYIGDDTTDEDAFRALKDNGLTIFVGNPRESQARYYLKNPQEVRKLLEKILNLYDTKTCQSY